MGQSVISKGDTILHIPTGKRCICLAITPGPNGTSIILGRRLGDKRNGTNIFMRYPDHQWKKE